MRIKNYVSVPKICRIGYKEFPEKSTKGNNSLSKDPPTGSDLPSPDSFSAVAAKMAEASKRKSLTLGQKLKIIHTVETNPGKKKSLIASEQGVPVTTLYSMSICVRTN